MLPEDVFFEPCTAISQELEENGKIVIISHLAIMETIHVIRKKIIGSIRQTEDTERAKNTVMSKADTIVGEFIKYVSESQGRGNIEVILPTRTVADHHHRVYSKLCRYAGHAKYTTRRYRHVGLGHADIEHAFLASDARVHTFRSTDGCFADLEGDQDFSHMSFDILRPPKQ